MSETTKTGAVMVVGGGISGMQSALDLAEAGLKVYLVEEKTAIGGTMARLDKTFPTNDCAMCVISPKLVDVGRHLNIDIHTGTKVSSIEGEAGNFKARLHKKARYIDTDKCTGCGECTRVCPVELPSEFDGGLGKRKAIHKLYAQAMPSAYAIEKKGISPCRNACPAGTNVQGYVQLIKQQKYEEAWRLIYEDNPLPGVCGRICTNPCELKCHRGEVDDPVSIRELKRFVADWCYSNSESLPLPEITESKSESVAVIGSGPAGLSAAYHLLRQGYSVTVHEAMPEAGGMLRYAIPEYRLPRSIVDLEIGLLKKLGVEIKTNSKFGRDFTLEDLKEHGYSAVFVAIGAHKGVSLNLPGESLDGVFTAIDFLKKINLSEKIQMGKRIVVVGGGNVAVDAARMANLHGADEVNIVCLEAMEEMPAHKYEIDGALNKGINIHNRWGPVEITASNDDKISGLSLKKVTRVFDDNGQFSPEFDENTTDFIEADTVILAVGQSPLLEGIDSELKITSKNNISVDPATCASNVPGVFAAGDAVTGPATVIDAIGAGKKAARSIDFFLRGEVDIQSSSENKDENNVADFPKHISGNWELGRRKPVFIEEEIKEGRIIEENKGLSEEDAVKEAERCLNCAVCSECRQCEEVCLPNAINHDMHDEELCIEVGAVILNPGNDIYDPSELSYLGYNFYPNVITSIEFERILAASGPFQGHLVRPSDRKEPEKIAWIQCVGSRNLKINHNYCSSVCCMYAVKEAVIAKEHSPGNLDTAIFVMDMRSYGKDFERYYNRAQEEHGVRFVKSRVFNITEAEDGNDNLCIRYLDSDGIPKEEKFDLVVLSVGLKPSQASKELAAAAGIDLDEFGFCKTVGLNNVQTTRPGIFAAGVFAGPKDIPETVVEASAGAGYASRMLADVRGTLTKTKEYPPERDVSQEPPRIGVFVCNCGINIGSVINVPEVVEYAKEMNYVTYAREFLFTCSQDSVEKIKEAIVENELNRVIIASCTPRTHAPLFQGALREAGLNPYLYEQVNIREHSSWVHKDYPRRATEKAKDLVKMSVSKAPLLKPVTPMFTDINRSCLVVGGGVSGMSSALSLAEQGFDVYLLEKEEKLGGNMRNLRFTLQGENPQEILSQLIEKVESNSKISVLNNAEIIDSDGYPGNYRTVIRIGSEEQEIMHGTVILATGAEKASTDKYLYGQNPRVIDQTELENLLASGENTHLDNIVMIQCAGSRDENRPYCSRVCCQHALKNALKLKEINPEANIYILYRDIRSYGKMEKYYTEARKKGIIFIRYNKGEEPSVAGEDGNIQVMVKDHVLEEDIIFEPDYLVLSTGIKPNEENSKLSHLFKVPTDADGFLLEAHMKLRPVDFSAEGLYLCGLAHAPKLSSESIVQANAASMRAATLLSKDKLENVAITATVNPKRCTGCGICVEVCDYNAREIDPATGVSRVIETMCQGCGACVVACPNGATQQKGFEKSQIMTLLRSSIR